MIINISVQEPYFSHILDGKKTIEGRLNKGKFLDIKAGDTLMINNQVEYIVEDKKQYSSFKEMLVNEGIENVVPEVKDNDEAVDVYYKFYTKEDEDKFGVVGIKLKKK